MTTLNAPESAPAPLAWSLDQLALAFAPLSQVAIGILDPQGRFLSWNAGAQALFGYAAEEICGTSLVRLYSDADITTGRPMQEVRQALRDRCISTDSWKIRKDGSRVRTHTRLQAVGTADTGSPALLAFMFAGETARSEGALPRLDQLVSGVTDYAIFSLDPTGHVTSWNDGARNIKGYEPQEIIGQHFSRFYPADAVTRKWPDYELRVATTEGRFEDEGWRVRKDGSSFWANVVISAIRDETGKLIGFCKITRDLSERRKHEEELRQSEQRLRTLMESLTDRAIFMLDANGFITSWSTGSERILGYRAEEIMWRHLSNLYCSEEIAANKPWAEVAAAATRGSYEYEGWRQGKDGPPFKARVAIRAVYDEQGAPCGYAHILTPLSANAVNQEASNAARALRWFLEQELRTRLVPIRNALELMKRRQLADPVAGSMLDTISGEIEELATTLRRVVDP